MSRASAPAPMQAIDTGRSVVVGWRRVPPPRRSFARATMTSPQAPSQGQITALLRDIDAGRPGATEELLELVYEQLRRMARARMARERPGQTLEPTALVHEVFLELLGPEAPGWENRRHFFAAAAEAMRRTFVHRARRYATAKRGGDLRRVDVDDVALPDPAPAHELLALDRALSELEAAEPRVAEVVKLRFFVGFTVQETASALEVSPRTVDRLWQGGRAWLHARIAGTDA